MLEINELFFRHPNQKTDILKGIEFKVNRGEMITILGPNGSGKTTILKCIAGLWHPQKGKIIFGNEDISRLSHKKRARFLALVPQEHEPPFPYSVLDIVLMGRVSHIGTFSTPSKFDYQKAEEALDITGIASLKERAYTKISGGERQLVLIARALAQDSPILILDEPTTHLDFKNQIFILSKVKAITQKKGLTVMMTLHDPNLTMMFSDQMVMIHEGQIVSTGSPQEVITKENLKKVYGIDVSVIHWNEKKIIYPCVDK